MNPHVAGTRARGALRPRLARPARDRAAFQALGEFRLRTLFERRAAELRVADEARRQLDDRVLEATRQADAVFLVRCDRVEEEARRGRVWMAGGLREEFAV